MKRKKTGHKPKKEGSAVEKKSRKPKGSRDIIKKLIKLNISEDMLNGLLGRIAELKDWGPAEKASLVRYMSESNMPNNQIAKIFCEGRVWVDGILLSEGLSDEKHEACWDFYNTGKKWIFKILQEVPNDKRSDFIGQVIGMDMNKKSAGRLLREYTGIPGLPKFSMGDILVNAEKLAGENFTTEIRKEIANGFKSKLSMADSVFNTAESISSLIKKFELSHEEVGILLEVSPQRIGDLVGLCRVCVSLRERLLNLAGAKIKSMLMIADLPQSCQVSVIDAMMSAKDLRGLKGIIKNSLPDVFIRIEKEKRAIEKALSNIAKAVKEGGISEEDAQEVAKSVRVLLSKNAHWLRKK